MKNIISCLILLIGLVGGIQAQGLCPPNEITTDPAAPSNPGNPAMENNFFDWTSTSFLDYFDPDYLNLAEPLFSAQNPYWSDEEYLDYLSGLASNGIDTDYASEEGWELITRGFGKYIDDSIQESFFNPYFLLYNKYTGMMRLHFSIPSTSLLGAYQTIQVKVGFNDPAVTGLFGVNGTEAEAGVSQPLDQQTETTQVIGYANLVPTGWSHVEFRTAYDPCTCLDNTILKFEFRGIETANVDLTGMMLGTVSSVGMLDESNFNDGTRLLSVLGQGVNPQVGVETYKSIDSWIEASKQVPNHPLTFIDDLIENMDKFGGLFSVAASGLKTFETIRNTLEITVVGEETVKNAKKYGKAAESIAKFSKTATTNLKRFQAKKQTFPSIVQGDIALSGTVVTENGLPRADFVLDNPGTSDANNTTEFGTSSNPAYPFYNEVLGQFALLNTPVVKIHNSIDAPESTLEDPDPQGGSLTRTFQLDRSSLSYVFNPAIKVDESATTIMAAIVVESFNEEVLEDLNRLTLNYITEDSKGNYITPFSFLDCSDGVIGSYKLSVDGPAGPLVGIYDQVYLRLIVDYVFEGEDRNGFPNRAMQIYTYPVILEEANDPLSSDLPDLPQSLTLEGSNVLAENVDVIGSVTIEGEVSSATSDLVTITGYQIVLGEGAVIGNTIRLVPGFPTVCGATIGPSAINLSSYCNSTYKGDERGATASPPLSQLVGDDNLEKREMLGEENRTIRLTIYPNPSLDKRVTLAVSGLKDDQQDLYVEVNNLLGQVVYANTISLNGATTTGLDLSHLETGLYTISLLAQDQEVHTEKIMLGQ